MAEHFPDATKKIDFILREDAVQCAEDIADGLFGEGAYEGARIVAERLKYIPAADVWPVLRAHWIETAPINEETMKPFIVKGPHLKCSNCGIIEFQRNYCPNCGADMREANK